MCRDLSEIASYARVDNTQYRVLKSCTPGAYTFILEGSRQLPRRVMHPKRKTIGIRVPDHPLSLALLEELGEPLLVSTLMLPETALPLTDPGEIRDKLQHQLDLVIDAGHCGSDVTTVIDLTDMPARLIRAGCGPLDMLGLN
jgi:tRNA threonylcarbamoyl adenosine modification protein (Sua5/YciO/YrdC/YwlC family)